MLSASAGIYCAPLWTHLRKFLFSYFYFVESPEFFLDRLCVTIRTAADIVLHISEMCDVTDPSYSASTCWMSRPTADYTSGK